jgi:hypothetical protein
VPSFSFNTDSLQQLNRIKYIHLRGFDAVVILTQILGCGTKFRCAAIVVAIHQQAVKQTLHI